MSSLSVRLLRTVQKYPNYKVNGFWICFVHVFNENFTVLARDARAFRFWMLKDWLTMLGFCVVLPNIVTLLLTGSSNGSGSIVLFACLSESLGQSFALTRKIPGKVVQQLLPVSWFTDEFTWDSCVQKPIITFERSYKDVSHASQPTNHFAEVHSVGIGQIRRKVRAEKHSINGGQTQSSAQYAIAIMQGEKFGSETST